MSSIDERVVQMQFENSQFEKGIKETVKSLGLLKKSLNLDNATDSIEHLQKVGDSFSLAKISSQLDKLVERTSWFGRTIRREIDSITAQTINLGKSLSVGQIGSGWSKYEQKTSSVQTIINATGKSIEEVNGYLDKLMWFSDETSYNFTEMTAALGTLTSSGGNIEKMIPMIEGMATATAFAGKSANEFSRVIYNLNQSYSQGYLSLMDWKSVELAQVGSEQLKQTLIDTAVELGTLKKLSDGTFKTKKGTVVNAGNMGSTLNEKWATKEVMEGAFGKFSQVIEEAYKLVEAGEFDTAADAIASLAGKYDETYYKAAKAAQEAKSFKEAIDATADAVSSGWMKTFELIFGNYDEARQLWTDLANALWEVFASGAEQRNETLEAWKEAGGRADLIQGITDALSGLWNIITAVKEAFFDIFPKVTTDNLLKFSKKVKELGANFKKLANSYEYFRTAGKELVTETNPLQEYFGNLEKGAKGEAVKKLQEALEAKGFSVGKHGIDGIFGKDTEKALKEFQESIGETADGIYKEADHAKLVGTITGSRFEYIYETVKKYTPLVTKIQKIAKGAFSILKMIAGVIGFIGKVAFNLIGLLAPLVDALLTVFAAIGDGIAAFQEWISSSKKFDGWLTTIKRKLEPVRAWFENLGTTIKNFFGLNAKGEKLEGVSKFTETMEKVKTKLQPVLNWFSTAYDKIKKFFGVGVEIYENGELVPDRGPSQFVQVLTDMKTKLQSVLNWFSTAYDKIKKFFGIGVEVYENGELVPDRGPSRFIQLLASMKTKLQPVLNWFSTAYANIKKFFGVGQEVYENGELVPSKFAVGIEKIKQKLQPVFDWFKTIYGNVKTFLQPVFDWFANAYDSIKNFFTVGDKVEEAKEKVSVFSGAIAKVKEILQPVLNWFKTAYRNVVNFFTVADKADESGKKITGFSQTLGKVKAFLQPVLNWFSTAYANIKKFFGVGQEVYENGELVPSKFTLMFEKAKQILQNVIDWFKTAFSGKTIADSLKNFWNSFTGLFKNEDGEIGFITILKKIGGGIKALWNWIKEYKGWIIAGAAAYFLIIAPITKLVNWVKGLIDTWNTLNAKGKDKGDDGGGKKKGSNFAKSIEQIGIGVALIAGALFLIGKMKPEELKRSVLTISAFLGGLLVVTSLFSLIPSSNKGMNAAANYIKQMGKFLIVLIGAIYLLGTMDKDVRRNGIAAIQTILATITVFVAALSTIMILVDKIGKRSSKVSVEFKAIFKGLMSLAVLIGVIVLCVKALGEMTPDQIKQGMTAIAEIALLISGIILINGIARKLGGGGKAFAGLMSLAVTFGVLVLCVKTLSKMDPEALSQGLKAMLGLTGILAAMIGIFALASLLGVGKMAIGAAAIGTAFAVLGTIIIAFLGLIGLLNSKGGLVKLIDSAGAVLKAIGKAFGNIAAGYMEAIGEGMAAIRDGVGGLSDNKNLEKDLEAGFETIQKVTNFLNEFSKESSVLRYNASVYERLMQVLTNIKQFGEAIGAVAEGINGLSKSNYEADTDAAIKVMGMVADALIGLQDFGNQTLWEKKVTGGIASWWKTTDTMIGQILTDIERFGNVVKTVRDAVSGLSDDTDKDGVSKVEKDTTVATKIVGQVADALSSIGTLASGSTWATPRNLLASWWLGSSSQIEYILKEVGKFGNIAQTVREAVSGLSDGGTDKNGKYKVENDVDVASKMVGSVVTALDSLAALSEGSTWYKAKVGLAGYLRGYNNQLDPIIDTIGRFADTAAKVRDAVTGISTDRVKDKDGKTVYKAELETDIATTVVDKIVKYLKKLTGDDATGKLEGADVDLDTWVNKNQVYINSITYNLGEFIPKMNSALSMINDLQTTNLESDTKASINAIGTIVGFFAGLNDYNLEPAKGAIASFFSGETTTDSFISRLGSFAESAKKMFDNFAGMSETTIEADANVAMTIFKEFMGLLSWFNTNSYDGSTPGNLSLLSQMSGLLTQLGTSIGELTDEVDGANMDTLQDITDFLNGLNKTLAGIKGVEDVAALFNDLKSLFTGGDKDTEIPSWIDSLNSDETASKLSTFVSTFLSTAKPEFETLKNSFNSSGYNLGIGLGNGLTSSGKVVKAVATAWANGILAAINKALRIESPSKKTMETAKYLTLGFTKGMDKYGSGAEKSLDWFGGSVIDESNDILAELSSALASDVDFDPVVRPVVDLSDVVSSSKRMNGLLSADRSIALAGNVSGSYQAYRAEKAMSKAKENAASEANSTTNDSSSVNVNGNFYIRSEQDVKSLASEIAALTKQQQRSLGASY